jgi:hypothetical protein
MDLFRSNSWTLKNNPDQPLKKIIYLYCSILYSKQTGDEMKKAGIALYLLTSMAYFHSIFAQNTQATSPQNTQAKSLQTTQSPPAQTTQAAPAQTTQAAPEQTAAPAQTTQAAPEHQTKVYFDKERNILFWPQNKQIWVRVSDSPDQNALTYLLRGERDTNSTPKGLKLDLSGNQYLRWINYISKDTVKYKFVSDGQPPKCSIEMNGAKPFMNQGKAIYGSGVTSTFNAKDNLSGVDKVMVSTDESPYQPVSSQLSFEKEKNYDLRYYAVDRVGNESPKSTTRFSIDKSAPITTVLVNGKVIGQELILSGKSELELSAVDSISGVKETDYSFDSQPKFSRYSSKVSLRDLKDGKHAFKYFSIDNTGNNESARTLQFTIDNVAPVPQLTFDGDHFLKNGVDYISERTKIAMHAEDTKSGIAKMEYVIGTGKVETYSAPFTVSAPSSESAIGVRAYDKSGNYCPLKNVKLNIDSKAPKSRYSIKGKYCKNGSTIFISPETVVSFAAEDDMSGVKTVGFCVQGKADTNYSRSFTSATEGKYVVDFWGTDSLNNNETPQLVTFIVDNTPPKIIETFSSAPMDSSKQIVKLPLSSSIFLAASDNASGVQAVWYSTNGKKERKYDCSIQLETVGKDSVKVRAVDNLGLTSEKTISFEVVQ